MPLAARVGTIDVNNPTGLDANTNLILQSRAIELLTQPFGIKGTWLHDAEVCTIHSDLATRAIVSVKAVVPFNLL
jgi:hypothetical protein